MLLQVDGLIGGTTLVFMGRDGEKQRQQKTRITIRIDNDLLDYFREEAAKTITAEDGPVGYQVLIGEALRTYIDTEEALGNIVRERARMNA
jgi:phosphohistidine swiveling domain-containing protein